MKKIIGAVLAIALIPGVAAASDKMVGISPLWVLAGGIGVQYQQSLSKMSGFTVEYAKYGTNSAGVSFFGGSYKKAFGTDFIHNTPSVFGNGLYWRVGLSSVTLYSQTFNSSFQLVDTTTTGFLPTAVIGYDWKINNSFVVSADFVGIGSPVGLSVNYKF